VTPAEALRDVQGYARANRIEFSAHALLRMRQRRVTFADVQNALVNGAGCQWQADRQTWKVVGPDVDGDRLAVSVSIDDRVLVVTVF
jgi:hypothetical protein